MNNIYECMRCGYNTDKRSSMLTHINRKNKCPKKLDSFNYTDKEIYDLSLLHHLIFKTPIFLKIFIYFIFNSSVFFNFKFFSSFITSFKYIFIYT